MCGRYALHSSAQQLIEHFQVLIDFDLVPRFNAAPFQFLPVVRQDPGGERRLIPAKWGLIPSWVKDPAELSQPINAKSETVAIKPMFRLAFKKSRVLVPADAFYEWKALTTGKQPYLIRLRDQRPMGFAGLLEHWNGPEGELKTFTILTTESNPLMSCIHNRMPAIISPQDYQAWLDPTVNEVQALQSMLRPYPERLMEAYPVSRAVNSPAHDGRDLLEPVEAA